MIRLHVIKDAAHLVVEATSGYLSVTRGNGQVRKDNFHSGGSALELSC